MMPKNDRSLQAKETALLALAQGDPEFPAFLDRYRQALPQVAELPAELVEELMAAVEEDRLLKLWQGLGEDPALGELAKSYEENAQAAQTYALLRVPEMTVLFAGLFLLGAHIKIHRTPAGKWEFLLEHPSMQGGRLEKIAQMLASLFRE